ncbi:MAG: phospholipid carrier-dependent glycosyltransferase [Fuerstiella sp.]|nr:phospholipid carrier-dependent glycosyltransferase [Fuerstiella sp.]MCP4853852.1 phospholipid carrier-dependent glycosyltransferase [Fuerstiella sp.]
MSASNDQSVTEPTVAVDAAVADDLRISAQWKPIVVTLMAVALLLRVIMAFVVEQHVQSAGRPFLIEGDANGYWELAEKITAGQDYVIYGRHVLRVPGFPLLLAASIQFFGNNVLAARLLLAVVGTGCCWLTYCLGRQVHSRRVGFWAALYVAICPLHVGNSVLILSETLFTFWMLLSLLSLLWLLRTGDEACDVAHVSTCSWRVVCRSLLTGALIGVTVLSRPGFLPWLIICCAAMPFLLKRSFALRATVCAGLVAGCFLVLLPWAARNATVTGHWVFTSLWSGPSLYDGLNPQATGASNMQFFEDDNVLARMSEFEMNQYYTQRSIAFARANPGRVISLAVSKSAAFLSPVPNFARTAGWGVCVVCVVCWGLLSFCTIAGLASRQWEYSDVLVLLGPLLLFLLVHMVFVGSVRYRLPVEFPLSVLAAVGWRHLVLSKRDYSVSR